ncbi:hypothetical protein BDGGKGIB_01979 [Nodularia sphaerocarpa UHCC 0038]|nr:hypothetical protein BDGGKGIB_01979 [Nodularia sphaerocarpa UHCC 0038]
MFFGRFRIFGKILTCYLQLNSFHAELSNQIPTITQTMVRLIGRGFTFSDRLARDQLGYVPIITREQGLKELTHSCTSYWNLTPNPSP